MILSPQQIFSIAQQVKSLLPSTDICITIPHIFTLNQQIELALKLEDLGINMIQTEGNTSKVTYSDLINKNLMTDNVCNSILSSSSSLSSVYFLSNAVKIPIIAASNINSLTCLLYTSDAADE